MADCRWMKDEFCVNADCPMCADYCPVADYPGVCRFEKRNEGELARNLHDVASNGQVSDSLPHKGFCDSMESLATKKQVTSNWISVEEKLPKDMGDVLVWAFWHEKWGVRLGWHSQYNDGWHICTASGDFGHIEVTHWMPLPHISPLQNVITGLHETKSDCADRK